MCALNVVFSRPDYLDWLIRESWGSSVSASPALDHRYMLLHLPFHKGVGDLNFHACMASTLLTKSNAWPLFLYFT